MSYQILCDSCTDFTPELLKNEHYKVIPLTLHIGDYSIVDDDTFDQKDFLNRVAAYPEGAKSSCPSPEHFLSYFDKSDEVYIITLSSQLSGSYNSAELAKKLYLEEHPEKKIHVIDSLSASVGQTLIAMKVEELASSDLSFEDVIKQSEEFRSTMGTKFVLETLENLRKNGRLNNLTATIASALNIKPVMSSNDQGQIEKAGQARGMERAIRKMAECIAADAVSPQTRILGIAHCNNPERAAFVKDVILESIPFSSVYITDTAGVSSLYAGDGGIVVCY